MPGKERARTTRQKKKKKKNTSLFEGKQNAVVLNQAGKMQEEFII